MGKTENLIKKVSTRKDECESWVEGVKSLRNVIWSKIKWKILVFIGFDEMQVRVKFVDPMEGVRKMSSKWEEMCFEVKRIRVLVLRN